jgi:DNA-binding transcriptional regulator YiaG
LKQILSFLNIKPAFAMRAGDPVATLHNWEQDQRRPPGHNRVLVALLDRNQRIVEDMLRRRA